MREILVEQGWKNLESSLRSRPVAFQMEVCHPPFWNPNGDMKETDIRQGTLALMVLKTLDLLGPLHGYAIARRIEQISGELLAVNQGTLYPVLLKLTQEGSIQSEWGASRSEERRVGKECGSGWSAG